MVFTVLLQSVTAVPQQWDGLSCCSPSENAAQMPECCKSKTTGCSADESPSDHNDHSKPCHGQCCLCHTTLVSYFINSKTGQKPHLPTPLSVEKGFHYAAPKGANFRHAVWQPPKLRFIL